MARRVRSRSAWPAPAGDQARAADEGGRFGCRATPPPTAERVCSVQAHTLERAVARRGARRRSPVPTSFVSDDAHMLHDAVGAESGPQQLLLQEGVRSERKKRAACVLRSLAPRLPLTQRRDELTSTARPHTMNSRLPGGSSVPASAFIAFFFLSTWPRWPASLDLSDAYLLLHVATLGVLI